MILARKPKMCSFIEWKDLKIVYKRLVGYFFLYCYVYCYNKSDDVFNISLI